MSVCDRVQVNLFFSTSLFSIDFSFFLAIDKTTMDPVLEPTEKKRKFEEDPSTLDATAIHTLLSFISHETLIDLVKTE